jgi:hypothetical protein
LAFRTSEAAQRNLLLGDDAEIVAMISTTRLEDFTGILEEAETRSDDLELGTRSGEYL